MKKRSLWMVLMTALLCLSMLFSSCTPGGEDPVDTTPGETDTGDETDSPAPQDEVIDYKTILAEWNKYLTVADTERDVWTSGYNLFTVGENEATGTFGDIVAVVRTIQSESSEYNTRTSVNFYNVAEGVKFFLSNIAQSNYNTDLGDFINDYNYNVFFDTIVEITHIKHVQEVETDAAGEAVNSTWETVTTYSYYGPTGEELADDLEERAVVNNQTKTCTINGINYYCDGGKIVYKTEDLVPYMLPTTGAATSEYKGHLYSLGSNLIRVFDATTHDIVLDYAVPGFLIDNQCQLEILSNGDILLYAMEMLAEDATEYDVYLENVAKLDLHYVLLSLETGEATELDRDFLIVNMFTDGDSDSTGIAFKGDYQYADVYRIVDKKILPENTACLILDNTLTEVAALPAILKNQSGLYGGTGENTLLVSVSSVDYAMATYAADMTEGKVWPYVTEDIVWTEIDGGFVYNGKVYNNDLEEIFDLGDYDSYEIRDGKIFFALTEEREEQVYETTDETTWEMLPETVPVEGETEEVDITMYCLGYINESGEYQTKLISESGATAYDGNGLYKVTLDAITGTYAFYNTNGEYVLTIYDANAIDIDIKEDVLVFRVALNNALAANTTYSYFIIK